MGTRLYVGNISFNSDEHSLRAVFEQDGRQVNEVNIITDRDTGRSRGFAFVEMATEEDAHSAIKAVDGTEIDGRTVQVNEARERPPRGGGH